jgi:tripartite-type tricarboxylate transporter receptor subunit TctC
MVRAGKLRAIAVSSPKRLDLLPDVPTLAESGVKGLEGFEADQWYGLVAPAGTPAAVVQKLNQVVNANLSTPDVVARLKSEGATAMPTSPEGFTQLIQREIKRWRPVVMNAKITAD